MDFLWNLFFLQICFFANLFFFANFSVLHMYILHFDWPKNVKFCTDPFFWLHVLYISNLFMLRKIYNRFGCMRRWGRLPVLWCQLPSSIFYWVSLTEFKLWLIAYDSSTTSSFSTILTLELFLQKKKIFKNRAFWKAI